MEPSTSAREMFVVPVREAAGTVHITPVKYESMDEWMKNHGLEADRVKENSRPPVKKQRKSTTGISDEEAAAFEKEALLTIGDENWIGLLQRYADVNPGHKLNYEEIIIGETAVPRFRYLLSIGGFQETFGTSNLGVDPENATFSNKQRAKQHAAHQAIEWLISNHHMPSDGGVTFPKAQTPVANLTLEQNALQMLGDKNWIGRLQEYLATRRKNPPDYREIITGGATPRFRYMLTVDGAENAFGDATSQEVVTFSSKKSAKQYVSKQAMDWLTSHEKVSTGTGMSFEPVQIVQQQIQPTTPIVERPQRPESPPYTTRVPDLSHQLNYQMPSYVLTPASDAPNCPLWDGYADFGGDPRIGDEGKVGNVKSVYGKKNAKEAIARQVYAFLKDIADHRLGLYEEDDRKRKRSPNGSQG